MRSSHGRNSPSDRSDNDSSSKSQKRNSASRGHNVDKDGNDLNLDDVYEKISDEELDFFDEENSKSQTPVSLLDMDWSALAAIGPAAKKDEPEDGESHRSKHTALTVLKNIGFSSNLLSQKTLDKIKEKCSEELKQEKESEETFDFSDFVGTGSLVLSKIRNRCHRSNLLKNMMTGGTVLNMRKDIHIRKELRVPPNKLWFQKNLFCNAPSTPADKELFMASASLYDKIPPGDTSSCCKLVPSMLGSVIECCS